MRVHPFVVRLVQSVLRIGAAVVGVLAVVACAVLVMTTMPLHSHRGALPALTPQESALADRLRAHVSTVAQQEHNLRNPAALESVATYLEQQLAAMGYGVERQEYTVAGKPVRNLQALLPSRTAPGQRTVVVGAHYDSAHHTPGANDNATGTAAVLELARSLRNQGDTSADILFVLYTNEEPPYFKTPLMGSQVHAKALAAQNTRVVAMLSLETMGYYSDVAGSQKYPWPLSLLYPSEGHFIAFVGATGDLGLVRTVVRSFRSHTSFPSEGIAAPRFIPGVDYSDHAAYIDAGYPALMVTDTAPYRYPHYHSSQDTPDKVDFERLARVVSGVERVVTELARQAP
ncbi:M28 family peptidase [Acidovorax sp. 106]|uniref:M28 family peptidase n=1 Tax=Acidovorax sp. 106 TaxID=2135637 RepID=UPI000F1BF289|nr:M28 family peptidase [Acidovorax sp. 106]RLJ37824.1 peptidase M28-like protein [Acidovorax sp. 106]